MSARVNKVEELNDDVLFDEVKRLIAENPEEIYGKLIYVRNVAYSVGYKHGKEDNQRDIGGFEN